MLELVAFDKEIIAGGLVAYTMSDSEIELHSLAVGSIYQNRGIGKALVKRLISLAAAKLVDRIAVYSRDTSEGFYDKLGFKPVSGRIEQPMFLEHGIFFQRMQLDL